MPNVIQRIAASLTDDVLIAEIRKRAAELDEYTAAKLDIADPALAQERLVLSALRTEFRTRTDEVL